MTTRDCALQVDWLGRVGYAEALALQERAVEARRSGASGDRLILLEHPPVITFGRSASAEHVLASPQALQASGIETFEVRRGGDVTYHAPGQLVGYLVSDWAETSARRGQRPDVHRLLRELERGLIEALDEVGVAGETVAGMTGVFARQRPGAGPMRKLASIGIGLRGWISYHGFALNVTMDLAGFDRIVPCGLHGVAMTSVRQERVRSGLPVGPPAELDASVWRGVGSAFRRRWCQASQTGDAGEEAENGLRRRTEAASAPGSGSSAGALAGLRR